MNLCCISSPAKSTECNGQLLRLRYDKLYYKDFLKNLLAKKT